MFWVATIKSTSRLLHVLFFLILFSNGKANSCTCFLFVCLFVCLFVVVVGVFVLFVVVIVVFKCLHLQGLTSQMQVSFPNDGTQNSDPCLISISDEPVPWVF